MSGVFLGALWDSVEDGKVSLILVWVSETPAELEKMKMPSLPRLMILTRLIWVRAGGIPGIFVKGGPGSYTVRDFA